MGTPQVDQEALEVLTSSVTVPSQVDLEILEVLSSSVTIPSQVDELIIEVLVGIVLTAAAEAGNATAVGNLAGVKVGTFPGDATAAAPLPGVAVGALVGSAEAVGNLAGVMVGAPSGSAEASGNLAGVGVGAYPGDATVQADLAGVKVGAFPGDATAQGPDPGVITSLSFVPPELIEGDGELDLAEKDSDPLTLTEYCDELVLIEQSDTPELIEGPSTFDVIGDFPVRYEMIRGSAVRPPFAVTLKDYAQNPINLADPNANAVKLILVRKHESETASKEVDLAFTSDKTSGIVYMPSWAYEDTATLPAGNYFGQIWVWWDGTDEPSKYGDITFVIKASAKSGS